MLGEQLTSCPVCTQDPALPSSRSALAFVRNEPGSFWPVVGHTLGRAALIGVGLAVAGERDHIVRKAVAGAMAIESFVLIWTHHEVTKDRKT
jgi:hypothetical protein